jgi:lysophospholipase L1-like esterase
VVAAAQWQILAFNSSAGEVLSRWSWRWFSGFVLPTSVLFVCLLCAYCFVLIRGRFQTLDRMRLRSPLWLVVIAAIAVAFVVMPGDPRRLYALPIVLGSYVGLRWAGAGFALSRGGLFRLVAMGFSLVLAIVASEAALRLWVRMTGNTADWAVSSNALMRGETGRYAPHHYQLYRPRPGYSNGPTHHNALGFRGPEIAQPKPEGIYRIVCIGGSTTYTDKVADDEQTYPAQLEKALRQRLNNPRIEVINAGVPGYTTAENVMNVAFHVSELQPDLVLFYEGVNDVRARFCDNLGTDYSGYSKSWDYEGSVFYDSMLARLALHQLGVRLQPRLYDVTRHTPPYGEHLQQRNFCESDMRYFRRNLELMIAMCRHLGAEVGLATFAITSAGEPLVIEGLKQANEAMLEVGSQESAPVLRFHEQMPLDDALFHDPVHVNEAGAKVKGEIFAQFVAEQFGKRIDAVATRMPRSNGTNLSQNYSTATAQ